MKDDGGWEQGTAVLCDCRHGRKAAELHPRDKLEIVWDSHGSKHVVTMTPRELLCRLAGTMGGSAIVNYVQGVVL